MKKIKVFIILVLFLSLILFSQEPQEEQQEPQEIQETQETTVPEAETPPAPDFTIGTVKIPRPFVHAKTDYDKGIYYITLSEKDGVPYFYVFNPQQELLFEEMAVVTPAKSKSKRKKPRIEKGFINHNEYFRLNVIKPDEQIMAFFLVKKAKQETPAKKEEPPTSEAEKI